MGVNGVRGLRNKTQQTMFKDFTSSVCVFVKFMVLFETKIDTIEGLFSQLLDILIKIDDQNHLGFPFSESEINS
jgi:hypothetical protein